MPKLKTRRAVAKRFRISGSGKIKYVRAGRRHLLTVKNRKRKRNLRRAGFLTGVDEERVKRIIPYA